MSMRLRARRAPEEKVPLPLPLPLLLLLQGWQFTLAEFVGGPRMIVVLALNVRLVLTTRLRLAALTHVNTRFPGLMAGQVAEQSHGSG